jgi:hypothetical protein
MQNGLIQVCLVFRKVKIYASEHLHQMQMNVQNR